MKRLLTYFCTAFVLMTGGVQGQTPVVVELYTSQGCSSCPPADQILSQLAGREDVIALALHVDYWDYIGWKDTFAQARFSDRQRKYAATAGRNMVYTPQMIVQGVSDIVGVKPMKLSETIAQHAAHPFLVDVSLSRDGETLSIDAKRKGHDGPVYLYLIQYTKSAKTHITRGENAGKTIKYSNIVDRWQDLGVWTDNAQIQKTVKIDPARPVVVIAQHNLYGPILGAARLNEQ